jgi:hypothetical protein
MLGALCVMHRALGHRPPASKKDLWTTTTSLHPFVYGRACSCLIIPDDLKLSTLTCMVMVWPSPTQLAAITISHFALSYTAWIQATIKRRCPCSSKYAAHLSMPDSNNQVIREAATVVDAEYIATFAHESHIEWRVGQTQQVWIALFLSYAFLDMLTSIRTRLFTCGRLSIKHLMRPVAADIPLAPHPSCAHAKLVITTNLPASARVLSPPYSNDVMSHTPCPILDAGFTALWRWRQAACCESEGCSD